VILAGLDEAGYGPILGPLVAGLAAFRVRSAGGPREAAAALGRALDRRRHGVRIGDSKAIHRPARGPGPLEREVLAALAARDGVIPRDGAALHAALGLAAPPADLPWYGAVPGRTLPLAADPGEALERGAALAGALREEGVSLALLRSRACPESRFNEAVAERGTKAGVLFAETAVVIEAALARPGEEPVHLACDRQGGRVRYGALLQARFPDHLVRTLREGKNESVYEWAGGRAQIRFAVRADASDPAVGLASMAAKYVREVWMESLNAWVLREAPGVRPTAGYWTDGLRFLRETAAARRRLGVEDARFVRTR